MADESKPPRWRQMSGEQRYRLLELLNKGAVEVSELSRTFGVSRQSLYRALAMAQAAGIAALTPKPAGRKARPATQQKLTELQAEKKKLERELYLTRQKYEVAEALLDLQRRLDRGEPLPGEKKARNRKSRTATSGAGPTGEGKRLVPRSDGSGAGDLAGGVGPVDEAPDEQT